MPRPLTGAQENKMAVGLRTKYSVRCDTHGTAYSMLGPEKVVFVSLPKNKNQKKFGGCPQCKKGVERGNHGTPNCLSSN